MAKLFPIESEFETTEGPEAYDVWLRAKVEKALSSNGPMIPHDEVIAQVRRIIEEKSAAARQVA